MDKNTLVGFILIGAVIVGFGIYNRPSQEERARAQHYQDSIQQVIKQQQEAQEKQAAAAIEAARLTVLPSSSRPHRYGTIYRTGERAGSADFLQQRRTSEQGPAERV